MNLSSEQIALAKKLKAQGVSAENARMQIESLGKPKGDYMPGVSEITEIGQIPFRAAGQVIKGAGNALNFAGQLNDMVTEPIRKGANFAIGEFDKIAGTKIKDLNLPAYYSTGAYTKPIKQAVDAFVDKGLSSMSKTKATNQYGFAEPVGQLTGEIASFALGSGGANALSKASKLANVAKAPITQKLAGNAYINNFLTKKITSSAGNTALSTGLSTGDLPSAGDVGVGLGVDAMFSGVTRIPTLAKKGAHFMRDLAYFDALKLSPTDKKILKAKGIDAGQLLAEKIGFAGSTDQIKNKLQKAVSGEQDVLENLLAKIRNKDAVENFKNTKGGTTLGDGQKNKYISSIMDVLKKKDALDLEKRTKGVYESEKKKFKSGVVEEANALKDRIAKIEGIDDVVKLYQDAGASINWDGKALQKIMSAKRQGKDTGAEAVYRVLGDALDKVEPQIRLTKAKQAPLLELKKRVKEGNSTGLSDILAVAEGVRSRDPLTMMTNYILGKAVQTPAVRTGVAVGSELARKGAEAVDNVVNTKRVRDLLGFLTKNRITPNSMKKRD